MILMNFIQLYDNWNTTVRITNDPPEDYQINAKIIDLILNSETGYRSGILEKTVVSFSFKNDILYIRTRGGK